MEPDRITQAFLSRFSEPIIAEAERLRSAGAVKQIFGGQAFIRARVEESGDVYRVMLKRSVLGWEWELSGPEQQHPAAIAAVMLERVARGESLPDSPNEVGDASLLEVIEEKLGRGLLPMEDLYVEKLEKRYKRYEMEQSLYDTDLVRLNPDGNYRFVGRRDGMVKSRGYRIEIGEIEAVLQRHPDLQDANADLWLIRADLHKRREEWGSELIALHAAWQADPTRWQTLVQILWCARKVEKPEVQVWAIRLLQSDYPDRIAELAKGRDWVRQLL